MTVNTKYIYLVFDTLIIFYILRRTHRPKISPERELAAGICIKTFALLLESARSTRRKPMGRGLTAAIFVGFPKRYSAAPAQGI